MTGMAAQFSLTARATTKLPGLIDEGNRSCQSLPHVFTPYNTQLQYSIQNDVLNSTLNQNLVYYWTELHWMHKDRWTNELNVETSMETVHYRFSFSLSWYKISQNWQLIKRLRYKIIVQMFPTSVDETYIYVKTHTHTKMSEAKKKTQHKREMTKRHQWKHQMIEVCTILLRWLLVSILMWPTHTHPLEHSPAHTQGQIGNDWETYRIKQHSCT